MDDVDLEEIRKARLTQLKSQARSDTGGNISVQNEQRQQQEADKRQSALNQILEPAAADRLGRIRLVKESRANEVENRLIGLARTGQLQQKVTENQLKELLNAMSETKDEAKIVVSRRKTGWDEEEDESLWDL